MDWFTRHSAQVRLKWHKIVHFGTVDQPTWNAVQFTHLLCFAKGPVGTMRVGCAGPDDEVVDLGSTIPDILQRGAKPSGLRKGACCPPDMCLKSPAVFCAWTLIDRPTLMIMSSINAWTFGLLSDQGHFRHRTSPSEVRGSAATLPAQPPQLNLSSSSATQHQQMISNSPI